MTAASSGKIVQYDTRPKDRAGYRSTSIDPFTGREVESFAPMTVLFLYLSVVFMQSARERTMDLDLEGRFTLDVLIAEGNSAVIMDRML